MDSASGGGSNIFFQPKEDLLELLQSLGFSRNASIKSLYYTGNYNADLAAAWIIENQDSNLDGPLEDDLEEEEGEDDFPDDVDLCKMVFVVNTELNMGMGKIAAQVAHAAVGVYRQLQEQPQKYGEMLMSWEQFGETKIVLKGDNTNQLKELAAKANSIDLPNYLVQDAGRTQIAAGSITVLGIMGKVAEVDSITGKLKLL
ncbi:hypothetical protein CHS0354_033073 [Potamilus streckersoni]|uniref:peptidyl-tRNA hydrolase n=1 Tax=Potamilus streckersoni TaxID=2493646 RepID=A0AAE0WAS2_9BIVA|nr:hypothetical protein CHS0354_033073 [Potamilus streckersoni]